MSNAIAEFIDGLPKAELHLHIEGTLRNVSTTLRPGDLEFKLGFLVF